MTAYAIAALDDAASLQQQGTTLDELIAALQQPAEDSRVALAIQQADIKTMVAVIEIYDHLLPGWQIDPENEEDTASTLAALWPKAGFFCE